MRIASLEAYNTPPQLVQVWEQAYSQELLPVQEAAVARHGVLTGRNLIVQAPTSAGKTFIGEMAATRAAFAGRKVLYLVPTKALAEDKFAHFSALYRALGLRVIVTTRDRRLDDRRFTSGDFDIAIAIPEKVRALWARAGTSQFLGLAVLDELQTLSEPERGPCLELLLGELRRMPGLQIVGLSACLGASPRMADYLNADWLETDERPIELRKGVLVGERFAYLDERGRMAEECFEGLGADPEDSAADTAVRLALHFARRGEPTILFVRDRATAVHLALAVAERLGEEGPNTPEAYPAHRGPDTGDETAGIRPLRDLERTAVREQLERLMACGVAFHSADLQFEDRRAVEQAFCEGRLMVLCSTPTLALGVNLPARNVIIDPQGWQSETPGAPSALSPISRADFENRVGRAGRLGWGGFGRGILLADSALAADTLINRYLKSSFSAPEPALMGLPPVATALTLAAGAAMRGADASLDDVYTGTYSAYLQRQSCLPEDVQQAAERCLEHGLLRRDSTGIAPTPLGQKAAASGVCFESFCWLAEWAQAGGAPTELEATFLAAMTLEAREAMGGGGFGRNDYLEALRRHAVEQRQDGALLERLLSDSRHDWRVRERAAWLVLALQQWIGAEETYDVERAVRLAAARLGNLGEVVGWLIETLAEIGAEHGWPAAECGRLSVHAERLAHGLGPEELPLARLKCFGLGRDHIRQLARAGLGQPEEIVEAGFERLARVLPAETARELLLAAEGRRIVTEAAGRDCRPGIGQRVLDFVGAVAERALTPIARTAASCHPECCESGTKGLLHQTDARGPSPVAAPPPQDDAPRRIPDDPSLVISADQPHQAVFFGRSIPLRPAEFRLLVALAEKAGKCVSYDALYDYLWGGEPLAEPGQIYAHRSRICGKLALAVPERDAKQIVMTIPKYGLMLNLRPQEVQLG